MGVSVDRKDPHGNFSGNPNIVIKTSHALDAEPVKGQIWEVLGSVVRDTIQVGGFNKVRFTFEDPKTLELVRLEHEEELRDFMIDTIEGVGTSIAAQLLNEFGLSLIDMLEQDNLGPILAHPKLHSLVPALKKGFKTYSNLKYAGWFVDMKIPAKIQQNLFKIRAEDDAESIIESIKKNPYLLQSMGMNFDKVDELAKSKFNVQDDDDIRLNAIVENILNEHCDSGHTYMTLDDMYDTMLSMGCTDDTIEKAVTGSFNELGFYYNSDSATLHPLAFWIMETTIAKRIKSLVDTPNDSDEDARLRAVSHAANTTPFPLSNKQYQATAQSLNSKISVITGGAGTGKTTVVNAVKHAVSQFGYQVIGIALTGKAAVRLKESIFVETYTIHGFMKSYKKIIKQHGEKIYIVIDEASMVDLSTFFQLITTVDPKTPMLLVGDHYQLPPIGGGLVLSEIIRSENVPYVELDIVQRQDETTGIPHYSNLIRQLHDGEPVQLPTLPFKNIKIIECLRKELISHCLMETNNDSQIICATNRVKDYVNESLQAELNEHGEPIYIGDCMTNIRVNDPIVFTRNDYEIGYRNGEMGVVIAQNERQIYIRTEAKEQFIVNTTIDLDLAYAITVHKSQGSQFKKVIVLLENIPNFVDNSWLYTAITRSENEAVLIGSQSTLLRAVETKSQTHKRQAFLSNLL
ncbi:AAA family ATPase [Vibrio astriarenae]|uniref:AAA family ATPase n=1 Tax=Vibrio astriarenae TaxID=1481923 RepID=UPI003736E50B